ncbi:hypothetical protein ACKVV1_011166 [Pyricularia oryzae]
MDSRSLNTKSSVETFISLMQLDPAPIETDKDLPPLPEEAADADSTTAASIANTSVSGSTGSSLGLSGSGHGAVYYLARIQRYSSYAFSIFTTVHLATTSIVPLLTRSVSSSESYLLLSREIYQTRISEPLLVAVPLAAHILSGLALRLVRRSQNLKRYGGATPGVMVPAKSRGRGREPSAWPQLTYTAAAGYGAAAAVFAHAFVNRGLPLLVEGDSADVGLAYVAHGFARHPAVAWVAYTSLLAVTAGHVVWGWARWLGLAQGAAWDSSAAVVGRDVRKRRRRSWLLINGGALVGALVWAAGGLGVVARGGRSRGWVGDLYDAMFQKVWL